MNTIPIVTVADLADNSFVKTGGRVDFKLSDKPGNGLVFNPDGLTYFDKEGDSQFRRVLLGRLSQQDYANRLITIGEFLIGMTYSDLGSDGRYLVLKVSNNHEMRVSSFTHSEDLLVSDNLEYNTYEFYSNNRDDEKAKYHLSCKVKGATHSIILSHTKINDVFYVWVDIFPPISDQEAVNPGGNLFAGLPYDDINLWSTLDFKYAVVEVYDDSLDQATIYLSELDNNHVISNDPIYEFDSDVGFGYKYHYGNQVLVIATPELSKLTVIDAGNNVVEFNTGIVTPDTVMDFSKAENGVDTLINIYYPEKNLIVNYRYISQERVIVEEARLTVDATKLLGDEFGVYPMGFKIIDDNHIALICQISDSSWNWVDKILIVDATTNEVKSELITTTNDQGFVEDTTWYVFLDNEAGLVKLYDMTSSGFILLDEVLVPNVGGSWFNTNGDGNVNPGFVAVPDSGDVLNIINTSSVDGVPRLNITTVSPSTNIHENNDDFRGFSEVNIADGDPKLMVMYRSLQLSHNELTLLWSNT